MAKSVGRDKLIGRSNWNTDFIVDKLFTGFKFFFTANSSDAGALGFSYRISVQDCLP
ncbi:hypothetical protein [Synechococcus sp. RedBA-s]|uniref:hypothetical protein n=1 Tax=Synechococcus sp. RedBA-s TaxID=2823741 RepID=UPI0020CC1546|nr:hypothetical protein [Synechococcus sp. RedBA-s]